MSEFIDYMDKEIEWEDKHDDIKRIMEEGPKTSLKERLEFDLRMINEILNREELEECDKRTIAAITMSISDGLKTTAKSAKDWEDFLVEVLGEEKMRNLTKAFFKRQIREINKKFGIPEPAANSGIIRFDPREK